MFSQAFAIASGFTRPVVISSRTVKGQCHSSIGAYVVLNPDGWILTVAHLMGLLRKQHESAQTFRKYWADVREMDHDFSSTKPFRKKKVRHFDRPAPGSVRDHSVWWGVDGTQLLDVQMNPGTDLALGRLEPFDPASVSHYPVFKTTGPDYAPGRSLCRLGFSFHEITPTYDEERSAFVLPEGSVPLPLFPLEGMFTRVLIASMPEGPQDERSMFIETSSPGLRGQSGGPIFDTGGVVWALQSHTRHYPLGFKPPIPGKAMGQVEHQFLNVGAGVHAEPIRQFLEQHGVAHQRIE